MSVVKLFDSNDIPFGKLSISNFDYLHIDGQIWSTAINYIFANMLSTPLYQNFVRNARVSGRKRQWKIMDKIKEVVRYREDKLNRRLTRNERSDIRNEVIELSKSDTLPVDSMYQYYKELEKENVMYDALDKAYTALSNDTGIINNEVISVLFKKRLLASGKTRIIYNSIDNILGIGENGRGKNLVGKILEQIRHNLLIEKKKKEREVKTEDIKMRIYIGYIAQKILEMLVQDEKEFDTFEDYIGKTPLQIIERYFNVAISPFQTTDLPPSKILNQIEQRIQISPQIKSKLVPLFEKGKLPIIEEELKRPGSLAAELISRKLEHLKTNLHKRHVVSAFDTYTTEIIRKQHPELNQDQIDKALVQMRVQAPSLKEYFRAAEAVYNLYKGGKLDSYLTDIIKIREQDISTITEEEFAKLKQMVKKKAVIDIDHDSMIPDEQEFVENNEIVIDDDDIYDINSASAEIGSSIKETPRFSFPGDSKNSDSKDSKDSEDSKSSDQTTDDDDDEKSKKLKFLLSSDKGQERELKRKEIEEKTGIRTSIRKREKKKRGFKALNISPDDPLFSPYSRPVTVDFLTYKSSVYYISVRLLARFAGSRRRMGVKTGFTRGIYYDDALAIYKKYVGEWNKDFYIDIVSLYKAYEKMDEKEFYRDAMEINKKFMREENPNFVDDLRRLFKNHENIPLKEFHSRYENITAKEFYNETVEIYKKYAKRMGADDFYYFVNEKIAVASNILKQLLATIAINAKFSNIEQRKLLVLTENASILWTGNDLQLGTGEIEEKIRNGKSYYSYNGANLIGKLIMEKRKEIIIGPTYPDYISEEERKQLEEKRLKVGAHVIPGSSLENIMYIGGSAKLPVVKSSKIGKILTEDFFMRDWAILKLNNMCRSVNIVKDYIGDVTGRHFTGATFTAKVLNILSPKVAAAINYVDETDIPYSFIARTVMCNKDLQIKLSKPYDKTIVQLDKQVKKLQLIEKSSKKLKKSERAEARRRADLINTQLSQVKRQKNEEIATSMAKINRVARQYWKFIVFPIYSISEKLSYKRKNLLEKLSYKRKNLFNLKLILSNSIEKTSNTKCKQVLMNSPEYDCLTSALINLLAIVQRIKDNFTIPLKIKPIDINLAASLLLKRKITVKKNIITVSKPEKEEEKRIDISQRVKISSGETGEEEVLIFDPKAQLKEAPIEDEEEEQKFTISEIPEEDKLDLGDISFEDDEELMKISLALQKKGNLTISKRGKKFIIRDRKGTPIFESPRALNNDELDVLSTFDHGNEIYVLTDVDLNEIRKLAISEREKPQKVSIRERETTITPFDIMEGERAVEPPKPMTMGELREKRLQKRVNAELRAMRKAYKKEQREKDERMLEGKSIAKRRGAGKARKLGKKIDDIISEYRLERLDEEEKRNQRLKLSALARGELPIEEKEDEYSEEEEFPHSLSSTTTQNLSRMNKSMKKSGALQISPPSPKLDLKSLIQNVTENPPVESESEEEEYSEDEEELPPSPPLKSDLKSLIQNVTENPPEESEEEYSEEEEEELSSSPPPKGVNLDELSKMISGSKALELSDIEEDEEEDEKKEQKEEEKQPIPVSSAELSQLIKSAKSSGTLDESDLDEYSEEEEEARPITAAMANTQAMLKEIEDQKEKFGFPKEFSLTTDDITAIENMIRDLDDKDNEISIGELTNHFIRVMDIVINVRMNEKKKNWYIGSAATTI